MITLRDLKNFVNNLSQEDLDGNVSIYLSDQDEYFSVKEITLSDDECGVLDAGNVVLEIDA